MSDFTYFNTDAIPDFVISLDGVGAMHPDYRKYATQQYAISDAVRPFTSCLPLALWHAGIHFEKNVTLELAPYERQAEVEQRYWTEPRQSQHRKHIFYDRSALAVAGRIAKRQVLGQIIDKHWQDIAAEIGSNTISIRHICEDIISENWQASGRITEFAFNRKRDKAAALLFEANCSGIALKLAVVTKNMTWTTTPVYKLRALSTDPLYCYGTRLTWPAADTIRVKGRSNQPDLIVPVDGFEIDLSHFDIPQPRSERCGGGWYYYRSSNSHFIEEQSAKVTPNSVLIPDQIILPKNTAKPLLEQKPPKAIADCFPQIGLVDGLA